MADIEVGARSVGRTLERTLLGACLATAAYFGAAKGDGHALWAGLLGALALYLLRPVDPRDGRFGYFRKAEAIVDYAAIAAFTALCDPSGVLWRAPASMAELFRLTSPGAGTATLIYISGAAMLAGRTPLALRAALFLLPFLFCLLISLGSPTTGELGRLIFLGLDAPELLRTIAGRSLILFLLNEAVVVGMPMALGRFLPREWRPHGVLFLAAFFASITPEIAGSVALYIAPYLPAPLAQTASALAAAVAQAGLWGETYLVTQSLAGLLGGAASLSVIVFGDWKSGAEKGFVYGLVFMGLLLAVDLVIGFAPARATILWTGPLGAGLLGAGLFPLARTIVESTDSTSPFLGRLEHQYETRSNFLRGAVSGVGVWLAFTLDLPSAGAFDRFLFGAVVGTIAFAGVDAAIDGYELKQGRRQHLRSWRVYALGAMLGGIVAGAIAWYLDQGQLSTIVSKYFAYVSLDYKADGRPVNPYIIRPLFSKWGATDLGLSDGGVKVFYDESLSGVIQWVFAAPLFSVNGFFLAALVQRSLKPLRQLASLEGLDLLVENAVRVLRWGLWMAPVIYSFLKAAPDPTWYNQDGLVRSAVAAWMYSTLPDQDFRNWSLDIFTALLAFDGLRVLIWFDHMGLRVATLVNFSFIGGDIADEKAARFLGKAQVSRAIPEGIRRFGTWAPLLLPFYIPRGAEWDKAWSAAEHMSGLRAPSYTYLISGYLIYAGALALALIVFLLVQLARAGKIVLPGVTGPGGAPGSKPLRLTNGLITSEWFEDGQGAARVEGVARGGPPIDLTRRPSDHAHPRGRFLFLREDDGPLWSLGEAPTCGAGKANLTVQGENCLFFTCRQQGFNVEARVMLASNEAVEIVRLRLINLEQRDRKTTIASLREWVLNETGVELRDPAYNAIHVGTWFVGSLNAIFAQNRLLKGGARRPSDRRLSPEIGYHAIGAAPGTKMRLLGYEDVKSRFYGLGPTNAPDSLLGLSAPRAPEDEGLLYGFEPCASLNIEVEVPAGGAAEIIVIDGWARDMGVATEAVARNLGIAPIAPEILDRALSRRRRLLPPPVPQQHRFSFAADGRSLTTAPGTPRPFSHVVANSLGIGAVLTNDGDIFSFSYNSRLNSFTPFRMGEGRMAPAGQAIYVYDLARKDAFTATFVPLRRRDAEYQTTYEPGVVTYRALRDRLELELTVFVSKSRPIEFKLLRIRNKSDHERLLEIVPMLEIVLAEIPNESLGRIETSTEAGLKALYFRNPGNYFVQGWAFVSTSLDAEFAETSRRRFLGNESRNPALPYMVEHGHPDAGAPEHERKVAAFCGSIDVEAGGEALVVLAHGQTDTMEDAERLAALARDPDFALAALEESRAFWRDETSVLRIRTNKPELDRLVNDWLPYQLLASRLWGRTGPAQRSGATGYRDQLQDVIPLIHLAPERARAQILLHAAHQFLEGDAVKWWHRAPNGGTGLGDRTHASDPHLWLPYVTVRYVKGTGDRSILDSVEPFLEAPLLPKDREGEATVPLTSRDKDTLLGHCTRAIDYTLARFGEHGLPLMGTGDWDDGMDQVGARGRGESVWMGFFLHGILLDIAPLFEAAGDEKRASRYAQEAEKLRDALDRCWRGDRYLRAYADDGEEVSPMSAMTSSWPVLSRAVDDARGRETIENALNVLGRPNRILLVTPAYTEHSRPYPGRSADYPPGVRENGGQYSHGVSWFVDALAMLGARAREQGDHKASSELFAKAYQSWVAISPLSKFDTPEQADIYGLPPHQQPADVYEGEGYEGHGGWAWYTGSAARMMSAAYALLGLEFENGELKLRPDAFDPKGELRLESVSYRGKVFAARQDAVR
ncbi:GH36-type glycosyl hydrolase domain-containing protein [Methylocystis heyeri]|uniref:Glycosyl transferase family 36 n=1 Tax=Methylocystis heyeri TaxID=391905 RepID=A0A6B8KEY3_9HYPH|nr:glycosyl transferase family 36 [Methylocystis heyeri]QGM45013.1 glycosyl transferase family 36 [Methylocystis heyeri]